MPEEVPWPVSGLVGPVVRWSPDGTRIAFRLFHDEAGIWLMDRDGGDLHRLVDLPRDKGPQTPFLEAIDWSPDGTRIAYTYPYDGPRSPLYLVDVEDGGDEPYRRRPEPRGHAGPRLARGSHSPGPSRTAMTG